MSQFPLKCGRKGRKISLWSNSPQQLRTNQRSSQKIWWQNVKNRQAGTLNLQEFYTSRNFQNGSGADEIPELHQTSMKTGMKMYQTSMVLQPMELFQVMDSKVLQQWRLPHLGSPEMCCSPRRSSPSFLAPAQSLPLNAKLKKAVSIDCECLFFLCKPLIQFFCWI